MISAKIEYVELARDPGDHIRRFRMFVLFDNGTGAKKEFAISPPLDNRWPIEAEIAYNINKGWYEAKRDWLFRERGRLSDWGDYQKFKKLFRLSSIEEWRPSCPIT